MIHFYLNFVLNLKEELNLVAKSEVFIIFYYIHFVNVCFADDSEADGFQQQLQDILRHKRKHECQKYQEILFLNLLKIQFFLEISLLVHA